MISQKEKRAFALFFLMHFCLFSFLFGQSILSCSLVSGILCGHRGKEREENRRIHQIEQNQIFVQKGGRTDEFWTAMSAMTVFSMAAVIL